MHAIEEVVGNSLKVDDDALAKGVLILEFEWPLSGQTVPLRAIYPDSFPRFRPIVKLRGESSTFPQRHCSPIDGSLCLIGRDTRQWRSKWTLRALLELQLADALNGTGPEDPQGEPAEMWWNSGASRNSYCLVDSAWTLKGAASGSLKICYRFQKNDLPEIKAVVTEVRDQNGNLLESWNGAIPPDIVANSREITIPWIHINDAFLPDRTRKQIDGLIDRFPIKPFCAEFGSSITPVTAQWFAVIYKSELGFQTFGLGWLFPFRFGSKKAFRPPKPGDKKISHPSIMIIPTYRAGEQDIDARVPAVRNLRDKSIAVIGLGAIGAPLAIDLARNGCGRLHLMDHDVVEPGNSIRWPLGTSAWGTNKSDSLPDFIRREYSWTEVRDYCHAVGGFTDDNPATGDDTFFEPIMSDVDLVVDATASYGVSTILSDYCRASGVPLISLYASASVTGGIVARFVPDAGCPTCLEFAYHAGTIERAPGFSDDQVLQQPPGCGERTFTGASYDLQELSLEAIRLIVETLENPDASRNSIVYTLSLATDGRRTPPAWRKDELPRAEDCSCIIEP